MTKLTVLAALIVLPLAPQSAPILSVSGPTTAQPGSTVTLSISLSGSSGSNIAGIQTNVGLPAGVTGSTETIGAASTAASKTVSCNTPSSSGQLICIISGQNQNVFSDGVIASLSAKLPSTPGSYTFTLTPIFASLAGVGVSTNAPSPFVVVVPSPCSVTGQATTSSSDVTTIINSVEAGTAPASFDLNGDGVVNIIDVQRVINSLPSPQGTGVCKTGP